MPIRGSPVASITTSRAGCDSSVRASSQIWVAPVFAAPSRFGAAICSSLQPALRQLAAAFATSISAMPSTCRPLVRRACARNIVPNLPAPMIPARTGASVSARAANSMDRFIIVSSLSLRGRIGSYSAGRNRYARPNRRCTPTKQTMSPHHHSGARRSSSRGLQNCRTRSSRPLIPQFERSDHRICDLLRGGRAAQVGR